jgi:glyoxylase-like metal-dependent hydrolase (beta-lactamase superfamily II)
MSNTSLPSFMEPLSHGIYAVDTGFHRDQFDAAYLVVQGQSAAFIDTGTNHAVPRLLAALKAVGLDVADVRMVIPTHVHLDHAGGVGTLMQALPNATCWVHERGARHMVDPAALYQGALAVYGQEEMDRSYGRLVGVPADRVQATHDGLTLKLGERELCFIDTPGHAKHHHCIWDEASQGWFTGDTFGLSYREFDRPDGSAWVLPTSTPVQFEPDALKQSVQRMLSRDPKWMYLTHYSRVGDVARLGSQVLTLLDDTVALSESLRSHPQRHEALKAGLMQLYKQSLQRHGVLPHDTETLLAIDVELNAQGIAVWLDRTGQKHGLLKPKGLA